MKVFEALKLEHQLFQALSERLVRLCRGSAGRDIEEVRRVFEVLRHALEAHEEIEEAVFGTATYASDKAARKALDIVSLQHRHLEYLMGRISAALRQPGKRSLDHPRTLIAALARCSLQHFESEESQLWPRYHRSWKKIEPALADYLSRRIRQRVSELERETAEMGTSVATIPAKGARAGRA